MQFLTIMSALGANWGLKLQDLSIQSLQSSGGMALLCAKVYNDMIHLLGH